MFTYNYFNYSWRLCKLTLYSLVGFLALSMTQSAQAQECPPSYLQTLNAIPGYAELDELVQCGDADTLAVLFFSNGDEDLSPLTITLNLPDGIEYDGFVASHFPSEMVNELDVSDPSNPVFQVPNAPAGAYIVANVGIRVNCDLDPEELPVMVAGTAEYLLGGTLCTVTEPSIIELSSEINIAVLNTIEINNLGMTDDNIVINNTTPRCHNVVISQDGISAYVNDFVFTAVGIDETIMDITSVEVNGTPWTGYTYDQGSLTLEGTIPNTYFVDNFDPLGAPANDRFDTNEQVTVSVCYSITECVDIEAVIIDYGATFGCSDELCAEPSIKTGSVQYTPTASARAQLSASSYDQTGVFCSDDFIWSASFSSIDPDPITGNWTDLTISWDACETPNVMTSNVTVGGVSVPFELVGARMVVDLTGNAAPITGMTDLDGDGAIDDVETGNTIDVVVNMSTVCAPDGAACSPNACAIENMYIGGKRNCGQTMNDALALDPVIDFSYGETSFATNETVGLNGSTTNFVTEDHTSGTCTTWKAFDNGYTLNYVFGSENLTGCGGSNLYAEILISGGLGQMNNPPPNSPVGFENTGSAWKDLRYEEGSATYMGNPVGATTWSYELTPTGDTIGIRILIPAGDLANDGSGHDYYFNLESNGHCGSATYITADWQVKEECMGCTEPDCAVVRSCHSVKTYIRWSSSGCTCVCPWTTQIDTFYRTNYGYTDKTMTQKVDPANIPVEDLTRFIAGDSMYVRVEMQINDIDLFRKANNYWTFTFYELGFTAPGMLDISNSQFIDLYHKDADTDVVTPLRFDCIADLYPGNGQAPAMTAAQNNAVGIDFRGFGVEGGFTDATAPQECLDKIIDNASPNWPLDQTELSGKRLADGTIPGIGGLQKLNGSRYYHSNNSNDENDDGFFLTVRFGELNECKDSPTDAAACYQSILDAYDFQAGDKIQYDFKVPVTASPAADFKPDYLETQIMRSYFSAYGWDENSCGNSLLGSACTGSAVWEFHKPGPIEHTTTVTADACEVAIEHTFTLLNPVPEVDPGVTPWFENEYRPAMGVEFLDIQFPSNLVYQGDMVIEDYFGVETPLDGKWIDETYGNLTCFEDPVNGKCCTALDDGMPAVLRVIDQAFLDGQNSCYEQLTYNEPLINEALDPFPIMSIGGTNDCNFKVKYNLAVLCPKPIAAENFQLNGQFALPYVKDHITLSPANRTLDPDFTIGSTYGTPFGTSIVGPAFAHNGINYANSIKWYWPFGPDPVDYPNHPDRTLTEEIVSMDNFSNSAGTYPPLTASTDKVLIADNQGNPEIVTYTVCAGAGGADHTNVANTISLPLSIGLEDVLDDSGASLTATLITTTATHNIYQVLGADIPPGECMELTIVTELLFCPVGDDPDTEICISTTSGCDPNKAALVSTGGACSDAKACYMYIVGESGLQSEWVTPEPGVMNYELCADIDFETRIKNVRPTTLTNIIPTFYIPTGITVDPASWEMAYPGGPVNFGSYVPLTSVPVFMGSSPYGDIYSFATAADFSAFLDANGLTGTNGNSAATDSNKVAIRFKAVTDCDEFVSGTAPFFQTEAADPCEATLTSNLAESEKIIIDGADPVDYAQLLTFADPVQIQCGDITTISLNSLNVSTNPDAETLMTTMCLTFPVGEIDYQPGSISVVSPPGATPNPVETIDATTSKVCIDIPDGIAVGNQVAVELDVALADDIACGLFDIGVDIKSRLEEFVCATGGTCDVFVLNSVNPLLEVEVVAPLLISEAVLYTTCDMDPATAVLDYSFLANTLTATYNDDITVTLVRDVDLNGVVDDYDIVLGTDVQSVSLFADDSTEVMGQITVDQALSCPVLLQVTQNSDCDCDAVTIPIDEITPSFFAELPEDVVVCPDTPLTLPACGDEYTFVAVPSEGATFTEVGDSIDIEIVDGFEDQEVEIIVTSTFGECTSDFSFTLNEMSVFEIGPYEIEEVCDSECKTLDLDLPKEWEGNVTIEWSPTTYLDDATSETPEICNPVADIAYTVTVTNSNGGCTASTVFSIDVIETQPVTLEYNGSENCFLAYAPDSMEATPAGLANYKFYSIVGGNEVLNQSGPSNFFTLPAGSGEYIVKGTDANGCEVTSEPLVLDIDECVFDVALDKVLSPTQQVPVFLNDFVTFEITVYNQGTVNAQDIEVTDYLPAGFVLADPNWFDLGGGAASFIISGPLLPNGSTTISITLQVSDLAAAGDAVNEAEISSADDEFGEGYPDIDSTPDGDNTNDAGGDVGTGTDDEINDDGTNDEDDHDPALVPVEIFDLALTKMLSPTQASPVTLGDNVTYNIEVCNQGTVEAYNIDLVDYIPMGMSLADADWSPAPNNTATYRLDGPLAVDGCMIIQITTIVDAYPTTGSYTNYAEISGAEDVDGNMPADIDSTPDDENGNDGPVTDDDTDGTDGDEDDHDPAVIPIIIPGECFVDNDGPYCDGDDVNLMESGGAAVSWSWTGPNGFTSDEQNPVIMGANVNDSGDYIVTITDGNGFEKVCTSSVIVADPLSVIGLVQDITCNGDADGAIDITVAGGAEGYTFDWDNNGDEDPDTDTEDLIGLEAGDYTVTITDDYGCVLVETFTVEDTPALTCDVVATQEVSCNGGNDGTVTITGMGGRTPYNYSLDGGAFQPGNVFDMVSAGMHTITIQDASGCVSLCQVTVTEPAVLTCSTNATDETDCMANDGTITVLGVGGIPSYMFSLNGDTPQASNSFTGLSAGNYVVKVIDVNGCETTCDATIDSPEAPMCEIAFSSDVTCFNGANGEITTVATGGSTDYEYSLNGGAFQASGIFADLSAGDYTVTTRNVGNPMCTSDCFVTIEQPEVLACDVLGTDATCNGVADGAAIVSAEGGSQTYEYSLDGTTFQGADNFSGLAAGTYTITVRDAADNMCTTTCEVVIGEPTAVSCSATQTAIVSCFGESDGEITVTPSGGTMPYSISANGDAFQPGNVLDGLAAGTYAITVRDANGCESTCLASILEPTELACEASATDETDCMATDGTVTISAGGGTPPYAYSLNGGTAQTGETFTGLMAGDYDVLVVDANGCETICSATVATPEAPTCDIIFSSDVTCNSGNNGSLEAEGMNGSGNYEFSLNGSPYQASGIFESLVAGDYTVTVRNVGNPDCVSLCHITIEEPEELSCTLAATDATCEGNADGSIEVSAIGGSEEFVYSIDGGTTTQLSPIFGGLAAGDYVITVIDSEDPECATICNVAVGEPVVLACNTAVVNVSCFEGTDGVISVAANGGTAPYEYSLDGGTPQIGNTFTGVAAGNHDITVIDVNGCISVCSAPIAEPSELVCSTVATDETDCMANDGKITASAFGGVAPYAYSLNGGNAQADSEFTDLDAGTYTVTITDANGCTTECEALIETPDAPTCSILFVDNVTCFNGENGSIETAGDGGSGSYEYSLDGGAFQASGIFDDLAAGDYTITVRNVGNPMCVSTCTATITEPFEMSCFIDQVDVNCNGGSDGELIVTAMGGSETYEYSIDGTTFQTSNEFSGLAAGSYTVTTRDAADNDCTTECSILISEPVALTCNTLTVDATCFDEEDGSLSVTIEGGTAPYEYSIPNSGWQASNTFMGLGAGTYMVTARDANGCITTCDAVINEPTVLSCSVTGTDATDCMVEDGTATITGTGGTPPYTYSINSGMAQASPDFTGLMVGNYVLTILDANNCSSTCEVTIGAPSAPMCNITFTEDVNCNGGNDGSFNAVGTGGSGNYEFSIDGWATWQSSGAFTDLEAGNYTLGVRNVGNPMCVSICYVTIEEPLPISCFATTAPNSCSGGADGSLSLDAFGGSGSFLYSLDGSPFTPANSFNNLAAGTYVITVADLFNQDCTSSCMATVTEPMPLTCETMVSNVDCALNSAGLISSIVSGGIAPFSYSLDGSTFQPGNTFMNLEAGTYTVTVQDANGCVTTCPAEIGLDNCTFDLALSKNLSPTQQVPVYPGDEVTYLIEVCNEGTITAYNVEIQDNLPAGFELADANWIAVPGNAAMYTFAGPIDGGDCVVVELTALITPDFDPTNTQNTAEITDAEDEDGNNPPDTDSDEGNDDGDQSEDDEDGVDLPVEVFDLALIKQLAPGTPATVTIGDEVTFVITIENQGTVDAYNVEIVDYLPAGLSLSDADWAASSTGDVYTTISGPIAAGSSTTVDLTVVVDVIPDNGTFVNFAEISEAEDEDGNNPEDVDSTPDDEEDNDGPNVDDDTDNTNGDEDDHDGAVLMAEIFDLALVKVISPDQEFPVFQGDNVTFVITVSNQGTVPAQNIDVVDYVPAGMVLSSADNNGWTALADGNAANTIAGPLAPGASVDVEIVLTIDEPLTGTVENFAEIAGAEDEDGNPAEDIDSTPDDSDDNDGDSEDNATDGENGDEDDHDGASFPVEVFDLALTKVLAPGQASTVAPGDVVTFMINITNQGTVNAFGVTITDYIPAGMTLVDADWLSVSATEAQTTLNYLVAPGTTTSVNIDLQVSPDYDGESLVNFAEISDAQDENGNSPEDIDSTPDDDGGNDGDSEDNAVDGENGDEDDHDGAEVGVDPGAFDLALVKVISPDQEFPVFQGDDVTFVITVINQGAVTAQNIDVVDYIPAGLSLSSADGNGWTALADGNAETTIAGPLAPGASVDLEIVLTIDEPLTGTVENFAEIAGAEDEDGNPAEDVDSTPDDSDDNDGDSEDNATDGENGDEDDHDGASFLIEAFDLALTKIVAPGQPTTVAPGDVVTFSINVFNQGTVDAYNVVVTDYIPAGMILADPDWISISPTEAQITLPITLGAGNITNVNIDLQVSPDYDGESLVNYAEISDAEDENGDSQDDIDSTPDNTPDNDSGGDPSGDADNETDGDGSGNPDDQDPETDEDDHDGAEIGVEQEIFDLALTKVLVPGAPMTVEPGDVVTFMINIFNQGTIDAYNMVITDYIPAGMILIDPDWMSISSSEAQITLAGPLDAGNSTSVNIDLMIPLGFSGGSLVNYAEISDAEDEDGNQGDDIDSTLDDNDDNDSGGDPNGPADNATDGDGSGGPDDEDPNTDEDDHDGAGVNVNPGAFDLALTKGISPDQGFPVFQGDDVTFVINVSNQGAVIAQNIDVVDYVPAGMSLSSADNNGWTALADGNATTTVAGPMAPGEYIDIEIVLTIDEPLTGDVENFAEISGAEDENGNPGDDVDSTPDGDEDNDSGGDPDGPTDNMTGGDGSGDPDDENPFTDEDDHDGASFPVEVFDLALTKVLAPGQADMVSPGSVVTFMINVFNQGTVDAYNMVITDYIPAGMIMVDANWMSVSATEAQITLAGPLGAGNSTSINIDLQVSPDYDGESLVNYAEISDAEDEEGDHPQDVDSTPDADANNDGDSEDNATDNENGDEDDHDGAEVGVSADIFDLALVKTLADGQSSNVTVGDDITFTITVINQGTSTAQNIEVVDYIPSGLSLNDSDWTLSGGNAVTTIAGPLAGGVTAEVDITFTIDSFVDGDNMNYAEIASAEDEDGNPADDVDSTPDADENNDGDSEDDATDGENGDEDDHDGALFNIEEPVFDLALTKTLAAGQSSNVSAGDEVTFIITVINQGDVTAQNIEVVDYIPTGLTLNDTDWTLSGGDAVTTFAGPLASGASTVIEITFTVNEFATNSIDNYAEIASAEDEDGNPADDVDSTPDADEDNDGDSEDDATNGENGDEDDHDGESLNVGNDIFDLALVKTLADGQSSNVSVGDDITFTITVVNQGTAIAQNVEVVDYIPNGLSLNDSNWTLTGETALTTVTGPMAPGASISVDITFTVDSFDPNDNVNYAEIASAEDENGNPADDVDSTPDADEDNDGDSEDDATNGENGDEDDHDGAMFNVGDDIFDLALTKQLAGGQSGTVSIGDEVTFVITVFNQGTQTAQNIEVVDYIPTGLMLNDSDWILSEGNAVTTLAGPLTAGASTTVEITFTVNEFATSSIDNYAEIASAEDEDGNPADDVDSTPDDSDDNDAGGDNNGDSNDATDGDGSGESGDSDAAGDEDDHDGESLTVVEEVFDLALTKTLAAGQSSNVSFGDDITFTLTVFNQGTETAQNIEVVDYIPNGLTLNDSDWMLSGGNAVATIAGPLAGGASTTVDITFTINASATGTVNNYAEIASAEDEDGNPFDDVDSTPDANEDNDGDSEDNATDGENGDEDDHDGESFTIDPTEIDLALIKQLAAGQSENVAIGDDITFTITVFNQGTETAQNIEVVDYIPTGLILNDSDWTLSGGDAVITIAGPLAAGASTSVDITFTVDMFVATNNINYAEIAGADDENGNPATDVDSTPDSDNSNDSGGDPNGSADDATGGDGSGSPDDQDPNTDEDDHDGAPFNVQEPVDPTAEFDLALTKGFVAGQSSVVSVGDDITFVITVSNEGEVTAQNIEVIDYMPAGLSLNDSDWTLVGNNAVTTIPGPLAPNESISVEITMTVNQFVGTSNFNYAEIASAEDEDGNLGDDVDSTPDTTVENDLPSEDDHDGAFFTVEGPVYDCESILNANIDICAYIIANPNSDIATADCDGGGVSNIAECLSGTSPFDANDDYDCTSILNANIDVCAYIIANPNSDIATADCDNGGVSNIAECLNGTSPFNANDDIDLMQVFDLSLTKGLTIGQQAVVTPGALITYTIHVVNEGDFAAYNVEVSDHSPAGLILTDAAWSESNGVATQTIAGPIQPGDDVFLTITFTVGDVVGAISNFAEISDADDDTNPDNEPPVDVDSTPDGDPNNDPEEEDDSDYSEEVFVEAETSDLELFKLASNNTPTLGDTISYFISVINNGPADAQSILVEDQLPAGLTYVSSSANYDPSTGLWQVGDLLFGQGAQLEIVVTVDAAGSITNFAEIVGQDGTDPDSDPNNGNPNTNPDTWEDDEDADEIVVQDVVAPDVVDLSVEKTVDASVVMTGATIEYSIAVSNDGPDDATGVELTDELPEGLTLLSANGANYNLSTGVWTVGDLPVGSTQTLTLTVEVSMVEGELVNYTQITAQDQEDVDSAPDNGDDKTDPATWEDDEDNAVITVVSEQPEDCDGFIAIASTNCISNNSTYEIIVSVSGGNVGDDGYVVLDNATGQEFFVSGASVVTFGPYEVGTGYDFTVSIVNAPDCSIDLEQSTVDCTTTALELFSFEGESRFEGNFLEWTTATEERSDYFILMRSTDGYNFEKVAEVGAVGYSNRLQDYGFMDFDAPQGISYYQLVSVDLDGLEQLSNIVTLERGAESLGLIRVNPNPTIDYTNVHINSNDQRFVMIRIYDASGKLVYEQEGELVSGYNILTVDMRAYTEGMYLLDISNEDLNYFVRRTVIKQ